MRVELAFGRLYRFVPPDSRLFSLAEKSYSTSRLYSEVLFQFDGTSYISREAVTTRIFRFARFVGLSGKAALEVIFGVAVSRILKNPIVGFRVESYL